MPNISIVVPYLGQPALFEQTLSSVLRNRPHDCEIFVPQSGYADPHGVGDEVQFIDVDRRAGSVECLSQVIAVANCDVLHWLSGGAEVTDGWCDWAAAHFQDPEVGCVSPLTIDDEEPDEIVSAGLRRDWFFRKQLLEVKSPEKIRSLRPLGPTQIAAFYRVSALAEIEGLRRFGESTFDLEIGLALQAMGYQSKLESDCHIIWDGSEPKHVSAFMMGAQQQRALARFAGADGFGKPLMLTAAASCLELVGAIVQPGNLPKLLGRAFGALTVGDVRALRESLSERNSAEHDSSRSLKIDTQAEPQSAPRESGRRAA
jgi:hypothetical protein